MACTPNADGLSCSSFESHNRCEQESASHFDPRLGANRTTGLTEGPVGVCHLPASNRYLGYGKAKEGEISHSHRHPNGREEGINAGQIGGMDGILDVTIHHARDIQNICIYGKQDVYAKFALLNCEGAVFSTQPVRAGGKNPVFNQSLKIPVSQREPVLKCEIWMMSCAQNYLEDQLLGFVLVPLASLIGKRKLTQDYVLTSTEICHTPAGTVCLSLAFSSERCQLEASICNIRSKSRTDGGLQVSPSLTSPEVMLIDSEERILTPAEYNKIEFPDLQAASENQHMVSVYFSMTSGDLKLDSGSNGETCDEKKQGSSIDVGIEHADPPKASFLHLGSSSTIEHVDYEMKMNTGGDKGGSNAPNVQSSLINSSSHTSLSHVDAPYSSTCVDIDLMNSSQNKAGNYEDQRSNIPQNVSACPAVSPPSGPECVSHSFSIPFEMDKEKIAIDYNDKGTSELTPLTINLEHDEPIVQQEIVDIYVRSMQQFTDSLAKMKLPLDISPEDQSEPLNPKTESKDAEKKTGHRVFYGSRAFF